MRNRRKLASVISHGRWGEKTPKKRGTFRFSLLGSVEGGEGRKGRSQMHLRLSVPL